MSLSGLKMLSVVKGVGLWIINKLLFGDHFHWLITSVSFKEDDDEHSDNQDKSNRTSDNANEQREIVPVAEINHHGRWGELTTDFIVVFVWCNTKSDIIAP